MDRPRAARLHPPRKSRLAVARGRHRRRHPQAPRIAFALAGGFAGLAGGLYAFSQGSISPETLGIPRSVDALVMVLLGGLNALAGPLLGAAAFTWLSDTLARVTEYWRAVLGATIRGHRDRSPIGNRRRAAALRTRRRDQSAARCAYLSGGNCRGHSASYT
jgi:hypothetical protein